MTFWLGRFFVSLLIVLSLFMTSLPTRSSAQSTIEKLFGINEVRTQELTPYWSEGLHTLLEIFCTSLRCEAERSDDDANYIFDLADVELPFSEFGEDSAIVVQIESIRAAISKDGLRDFNGFPANADITISGITLNDEGILEIAAAIFEDDPRIQRLIAREIAKESLSFTASLSRGEEDYSFYFSVKLLSGDQIEGSVIALATSPIFTYLVKDEISVEDLSDIEDQAVRGALLYDSIAWDKVLDAPVREASMTLTEVNLLDKVFGPFLIDKKSDGEREFWEKVKIFAVPVAEILSASEKIDGGVEDIIGVIDFFANWRSKQGSMSVSIAPTDDDDLISSIDQQGFNPADQSFCSAEAIFLPVFLAGFGVVLPYFPEVEEFLDDDMFQNIARDEEFISEFKKDADELVTSFLEDVVDCPTGVLSFAYQAGTKD